MAPRNKHTRVKTARGRKSSSTRWLQRQLNDPYVKEAKRLGYRSRAAFKLIEMEEKLNIIKKDMLVVDLGAAPGGWTQVAVEKGAKHVIGIDLLEIEDMEGAEFIQMDFTDNEAPDKLLEMLGGEKPDMVISDLSPYTTGHKKTDHLKIMALVEMAYDFAVQVLKPGGHFIAKVFQGGAQSDLLKMVKADFETVKHMKPPASRKGSPEQYLVALNFRKTD
jgi:23S rRNA (uridine2552-2'-O)-methyltransferase